MPDVCLVTMGDPFYDADLALALEEHRWPQYKGWSWGLYVPSVSKPAEFVWIAPKGHRGSQQLYESRSHATNSQKRNGRNPGHLGKENDGY